MKRIRKLLIGAVSVFALSALPLHLDLGSLGSYDLSSAQAAKGGNGGGGGNGNGGGGNGGGGGKSNGGGHGNGGKAGGNSHASKAGGKSASAAGHSGSLFGKSHSRSGKVTPKSKSSSQFTEKRGSASKVKAAKANSVRTELAALPQTMVAPELQATVKEKNLHAKLAGLNSLNRNYHAYLNSQSPRFASIATFVRDSAEFDIATERLAAAEAELAAAQTDFDARVASSGVVPYDGAIGVYDDPTLAELEARLDHLNSVPVAPEDEMAWAAERDALESVLASSEADALADAETSFADAETIADEAAVGTDDEALRAALLGAANKNRVQQYGDDYLDDNVMDWARDVLGVGDDFGKIDEVRESLETSD